MPTGTSVITLFAMTVLLTKKVRFGGLTVHCDVHDDLRLRLHRHPSSWHGLCGRNFDIAGTAHLTSTGVVLGRMSINWNEDDTPTASERAEILDKITTALTRAFFGRESSFGTELDAALAVTAETVRDLTAQHAQASSVDITAARAQLEDVQEQIDQLRFQLAHLQQQEDALQQICDEAEHAGTLAEDLQAARERQDRMLAVKATLTGDRTSQVAPAPALAAAGLGLTDLD